MSRPDLERWNARYDTDSYVFGEAPNAFLVRHASDLSPGRALCIADGEGRNGVWLTERGWDVLSIDFSEIAQKKAAALAERRGVSITLEKADVHDWAFPTEAFDLVADIFSQFSSPLQRPIKWNGMLHALRPGGYLILQGYTPGQLRHGTGGPSQVENLYTPALLAEAFGGLEILCLEEREEELQEGVGHHGLSATIGLVARKPQR